MYISRLSFHTLPGKSGEVQERLGRLVTMVEEAGGVRPRVLRSHFASPGAPDLIFEQEASDPGELESQIAEVTGKSDFDDWSAGTSRLLAQSPKREVFSIVG